MAAAFLTEDIRYCTCKGLLAVVSWWPLMEAVWQTACQEQWCALKGPDRCLQLQQYYSILICDGDGSPGAKKSRYLFCGSLFQLC